MHLLPGKELVPHSDAFVPGGGVTERCGKNVGKPCPFVVIIQDMAKVPPIGIFGSSLI